MLSEPLQVTLHVIEAFNQIGISYLIGGSLASAVHSIARATMDADLVADVKPEHIRRLTELLETEFYVDPEMVRNAVAQRSSFNLVHLETMFKVDVFILQQRPFDLNRMRRRILHTMGDSASDQAYFSTAEDIILAKLEWFRAGGEVSDRQWRDIIGILDVQGSRLDFDYMQKWAQALSVADLLQRATNEAP
jgi:hypothetical protein